MGLTCLLTVQGDFIIAHCGGFHSFFNTLINGTIEEKALISFNIISSKNREYFEVAEVSELIREMLEAGNRGTEKVHVYDYDLTLGEQVGMFYEGRCFGRDVLQLD